MHDASKYRQIKILMTLGGAEIHVAVLCLQKSRRGPETQTLVGTYRLTAEPTDSVSDVCRAAALGLMEAADRL